jgi:hypothetical protein
MTGFAIGVPAQVYAASLIDVLIGNKVATMIVSSIVCMVALAILGAVGKWLVGIFNPASGHYIDLAAKLGSLGIVVGVVVTASVPILQLFGVSITIG